MWELEWWEKRVELLGSTVGSPGSAAHLRGCMWIQVEQMEEPPVKHVIALLDLAVSKRLVGKCREQVQNRAAEYHAQE